ncbi:MAG: hypothetical protein ACXVJ7_18875 [Acidimicrobiia bacterium]
MSGAWRVSDDAELAELRRARRRARELRTEEAWNQFVAQAERCQRLGVLDDLPIAGSDTA